MQMLNTGVSCVLKVLNKTNAFRARTNDRTKLIILVTYLLSCLFKLFCYFLFIINMLLKKTVFNYYFLFSF